LISGEYDGKFKYYRTPRVFAVEIRKYHHKNRLEKFYEIEQCKIAINNKLAILEQRKLTIPYYIQYTRRMAYCILYPHTGDRGYRKFQGRGHE
jgi:hypothetical protein